MYKIYPNKYKFNRWKLKFIHNISIFILNSVVIALLLFLKLKKYIDY